METGLTLSEQQELNKLSDALNLNSEIKEIAEKLLNDFKTKIGSPYYGQKPLLAINCAVLVAYKSNSQPLENQGKLGESPLITQLVRRLTSSNNNVSIEEFLGVLKQFISTVPLPDEITIKLRSIINKFAFSYTFFIKYQKLMKQLELQEYESENYTNYLKNFIWLVYITARDSILHGHVELVEAVFLLISTLTHMLSNLPNEVKILYLDKNGRTISENGSQKKSEELAQELVFELLTPNSTPSDDIASYYKTFQDFLTKLVKEKVIVSMGGDSDNKSIYSQGLLIANFNKLDEYYQKGLKQDDLDERFYIYENKTFSPGKFTPFAKQGSANKLNINVSVLKEDGDIITERSQRSFSSQFSDYKSSKQVTLGSNLRDIKSTSRSIPMSPFGQSHSGTTVPSTPMTIALEMYNWLSDKVKLKKNDAGLPPTLDKYLSTLGGKYRDEIINRATAIIENVLSPEKENLMNDQNPLAQKKLKDKHNQILNLYFKILEDLLVREEKKTKRPQYYEILKNEDFHKALVACAIETVFFVNNYSNLTFTKLLELCKIQPFEFWRMIASFIKSDSKMPLPIKKHFYELELKILMHLVWKKDSVVHQLVEDFIEAQKGQSEEQGNGTTANGAENEKDQAEPLNAQKMSVEEAKRPTLTHSQELFFKRVLHHTAFQVYQLCDLLKLDETISEQVWTTIKHILSSQTALLIEHHIGQLILCCIYAVCKINRRPIKFQEIIAKCQELSFFNKDDFTEIVHQVYINENERADLIKFYNTVFMGPMKSFICSLGKDQKPSSETKQPSTPVSKPLVPQLVLDSPLKEFIPQQIMYSGVATPDPKGSLVKGGWTPQTKALYAFGESPCRALETINKYASKKPFDHDESQDNFLPGSAGRKQIKPNNTNNNVLMDKIIDERSASNSMMKQMPSKRNLFGTTPNPTGGDKKVNIEEYAKPKVPNNSTSSSSQTQDKTGSQPSSQGSK